MILKTENLARFYGDEQVLKDINMELSKGEILGIVGESGSGKSTLGRALSLFEKPDKGMVFYNGKDISLFNNNEKKEYRRNCQMILQDSLSSLDPTMTIGNSLLEVLKYNSNLNEDEATKKINELLKKVSLKEELLNKKPMELSGGERQRINVLRALLIEPSILICDEITSSLDVLTRVNLLKLLKQLKDEMNLTVIFISHDINLVKNISDRILVMNGGEIREELKREDGFTYSDPYTEKLFKSLPINHPSKRQNMARHLNEQLFNPDGKNTKHFYKGE